MKSPEGQNLPTDQPWTWRDWIDWEWFLAGDEEIRQQPGGIDVIEKRDTTLRASWLEKQGDLIAAPPASRRHLLRFWINERRLATANAPGSTFHAIFIALCWLLAIGGALIGWGAAVSVLQHQPVMANGTREPVNVFLFIAVCLIPPFSLAIISFLALVWPFKNKTQAPWLLRQTTGWISHAMQRLWRRAWQRDETKRREWEAWGNRMSQGLDAKPGLWQWPAVLILQWFGLGFTIAVFAATFTITLFNDKTFGWQTSYRNYGTGTVHAVTRTVASPWLIAGFESFCPSPSEIAATQVIPSQPDAKEPDLAISGSEAWLRFLLAASLCYGVLPRILLIACGTIAWRRSLARDNLTDPRADRLFRRLDRPQVSISIHEDSPAGLTSLPRHPESSKPTRVHREAVLIRARDGLPDASAISGFLTQNRDWTLSQETATWPEAATLLAGKESGALVLLEAAFMVPTMALHRQWSELREQLTTPLPFLILLVGANGPPGQRELAIWQKKVAEWNDRWIEVEPLATTASS
jgi:hypothetical protein